MLVMAALPFQRGSMRDGFRARQPSCLRLSLIASYMVSSSCFPSSKDLTTPPWYSSTQALAWLRAYLHASFTGSRYPLLRAMGSMTLYICTYLSLYMSSSAPVRVEDMNASALPGGRSGFFVSTIVPGCNPIARIVSRIDETPFPASLPLAFPYAPSGLAAIAPPCHAPDRVGAAGPSSTSSVSLMTTRPQNHMGPSVSPYPCRRKAPSVFHRIGI